MKCDEVLEHLSAWCDGQLNGDDRASVEQHMARCDDCRRMGDELSELGESLHESLQTAPEQQERLVEAFLASVPSGEVSASETGTARLPRSERRRSGDWRWYLSLLVSAAAGFLLAWGIMSSDRPDQANNGEREEKPSDAKARDDEQFAAGDGNGNDSNSNDGREMAVVNVSVGQIESRENSEGQWRALLEVDTLGCNPSSEIRTQKEALCELQLPNGNIVRLDESSQIKFVDSDQIQVVRGQVWCRAGKDGEMSVCSLEATPNRNAAANASWTAKCVGNTCVVTSVKGHETSVFASKGSIDFLSDLTTTSLKRGEMVRIVDGKIVAGEQQFDPVAATRWIHAILKEKGPDNPELNERIRELLVHAGYAKVNFLYEDEIRNLGQHAVLPLMEYLASQQFQEDRRNRRRAAKLAADLAPSWAIPDLIDRIDDHDSQVAASCGNALVRLAGTDLSVPVDSWGDDIERRKEVQKSWREWWQLRKDQMPKRPMSQNTST